MKSPKEPSKKPSLPSHDPRRPLTPQVPSKGNSERDESRRTNVLMEQMLSKFDTFGESLSAVREDVTSLKSDMHTVKEDIVVLKAAVRTNGHEIRSLKEAVQGNTDAIHALQSNRKNINQRLSAIEA